MKNIVYLTGLLISFVLVSTTLWLLNSNKTYSYSGYSNYQFSIQKMKSDNTNVVTGNEEELTNNTEIEDLKLVSNDVENINEDNLIENIENKSGNQIAEQSTEPNIPELPAPGGFVEGEYPYYLKLNRTHNVINVYVKDENGEYTIPYKAIICCTGTATPKAGAKHQITTYRKEWNGLRGGVYGQYAVQIVGNILFHSVPYTKKNKSALEYWEYDKMGTKCSMGCIRLTVEGAKWIYENVPPGTWVEFYEDDEPGPFGKPETMKISQNTACRGWDPTDDVPENPWKNPELASIGMEKVEDNTETKEENIIINDYEYISGDEIIEFEDIDAYEKETIENNNIIINVEDDFEIESGEIIGDGEYQSFYDISVL